MHSPNPAQLTVFYDGRCPFCQKEVAWLQTLNTAKKIAFLDINAVEFNAAQYGLGYQQLMAEIHALKADGELIKGMPVFRAMYQAVGLGWLMAPTGWPLIKYVFDWFYQIFAKNRFKLGRLFRKEKLCQRCIK